MVYFKLFQIKDLSLHQLMVLALLISYDNNNKNDITLTSKAIAKHFYYKISIKTVENCIPILEKLGYITKSLKKIRYEDSGDYNNKRYIYITPKIYAIINEEEPIIDVVQSKKTSTFNVVNNKDIKPIIDENNKNESPTRELVKANSIEISETESGSSSTEFSKDFKIETEKSIPEIPKVEITDEKLDWAKRECPDIPITKERIESLNYDDQLQIFYGDNGIWKKNNENSENKHLIELYHKGGSQCKLSNLNKDKDFMRINYHDFMYLLEQRSIKLGDVTQDIYNQIFINELPKRPMNNNNSETAA